ncbi:MAG: CoA transferase, partial [Burkholderiales bacterium]
KGQDPVRAFLREAFRTKTRAAWTHWARGRDIPFAPVNTLPEVLDDPHFRERGMVLTDERGWDHLGTPVRFEDEPGRVHFDLPAQGQHSREILQSLGYSESEIARLADEGAIR